MRVLVAEDYQPLAHSLKQGLEEEGFAVDLALTGDEAWWYAQINSYDLVVLDLMLPGIGGIEILKRMRRHGQDAGILILTAKDQLDDKILGLDSGADDYLTKPFEFDELLARLRALLRRRFDKQDPVIRIGPLQIDTAAKQVFRDRQPIELTAREYSLLECLALRSGQPVSRAEIWDHLYDFATDQTSNVIDVYIGYLRRKIDTPHSPSMIETRRGQGYVLKEPS